MATDTMDLDMDIDMGPVEDFEVADIDLGLDVPTTQSQPVAQSDENVDATQPTPNKVHVRGVDNLSTDHLKAYASEHEIASFKRIEWIDDTSLNFVYEDAQTALEVLRKLAAADLPEESQLPYQMTAAKPLSSHPDAQLYIRLAVVGDQKVKGARERSRFYLFNPEYDHAAERKRDDHDSRSRRRYRERDGDDYRARRYDDRENRRREADADFDASLYDDDEGALAARQSRSRRRDSRGSTPSSSEFRSNSRRGRYRGQQTKELFPDRIRREGNRLRDRSASPMRDIDGDDEMRSKDQRGLDNKESARRLKQERFGSKNIELFPSKIKADSTPKSSAFDTVDETASLLAARISVPMLDGSNDDSLKAKEKRRLQDRITSPDSQGELSIRGAAGEQDLSIKGAANSVKELFPNKFGGPNSGKELFSNKLQGRGGKRNKAEDLFF